MQEQSQVWRKVRVLAGASLGIGSALSLNSFILSTFAPYYISQFGWTKEQWTWLSVIQMLSIVAVPIAGRLADLFGVWRTAAVGALSFPVFLLAIAFMDGSLMTYFWIYFAQTLICATTTATVYTRVVAQAFQRNRGLMMGLAGASSPLIGALGSPLVSAFVRNHGFRAGYICVAVFCAVSAVLTLWLLRGVEEPREKAERIVRKDGPGDYAAILAMPTFWLMLVAIFLVNTPFALAMTQIKLVVTDQGLPDSSAALMVSALGGASVAGRFLFGFAVDRLPPHKVAAFSFILPMIGLLLLVSPLDSFSAVLAAIVLIGLAFGSEADVIPVLVTRYFGIHRFGTVLGLLTAAMAAGMSLGTVILALVLRATHHFNVYMLFAAAATAAGSALFLMLGRSRFRLTSESYS